MAIKVVTAEQRLSMAGNKTSMAIFGPWGVGKTSLLKTLPAPETVCIDLEAGLKSVERDWKESSLEIDAFADFQDIVALIGGPDATVDPSKWYSQAHYDHARGTYAGTRIAELLSTRRHIFLDSLTDLTRIALAFAKRQPEAFSEKSGKPDTRGAYGLLAQEIIRALKHLQRAHGKTIIFVGILDLIMDDYGRQTWLPQMEGARAGRELPGIVDQVMSMQLFRRDPDGAYVMDEKAEERRLVCRRENPFGLPAKDRSGRLNTTEPPDLGAVLAKINA